PMRTACDASSRTYLFQTSVSLCSRLSGICWAPQTLEGEPTPGSAALISEEWAIHSNTGFVWLPEGQPEETSDDSYRHLGGNWYGWRGWDNW
uniref:hypothetical protein n=1 Tax=Streptosporangium amethystogenes TaxID=2002 RepID=UPI001B805508